MLGKIEGRRRRGQQGMKCHHRINEHEFEQTLEGSEGQGSLACCSPWGRKESDMTSQLNNNNDVEGKRNCCKQGFSKGEEWARGGVLESYDLVSVF